MATVPGVTVPGTGVSPAPDQLAEIAHDVDRELAEELDDTIRCGRCKHGITAGSYAIEVGGAHAHTFRNPAGWSYRIGCFADAPGAAAAGAVTTEDTWFAGYGWRYAHCDACGRHLGWWFVGGADAFAGLVLAWLT